MRSYDVVIVGGGLSGLSTGIHLLLRRPNLDVLIIERLSGSSYGRYHRMCGEALSDAALREMSPIQLLGRRHRILFAEEHWPDGTVIKARAKGYIIDRPELLRSMQDRFRAAGGTIRNEALKDVTPVADGYILNTEDGAISCSWLVGADGAFSRVRKQLFHERPRSMIAVKQYLLPRKMEADDTIVFHYHSRYQGGYRWEFPCGESTNMGFPKGSEVVTDEVEEENGRYIPIGALHEVVSGRACLVGDAAGMVNPVSFGGIRIALLSGRKAAEALSIGNLQRYQVWWGRSPYSNENFYQCYLQGRDWSDEDMADFISSFRRGYGLMSFIRAFFAKPEQRKMVMAYFRSFKYGW
jgi:digeranylgeranylglycerophospholipid reductase